MFFGPINSLCDKHTVPAREGKGAIKVISKRHLACLSLDLVAGLAIFLIGIYGSKFGLSSLVQNSFVAGGAVVSINNFWNLIFASRARIQGIKDQKKADQKPADATDKKAGAADNKAADKV